MTARTKPAKTRPTQIKVRDLTSTKDVKAGRTPSPPSPQPIPYPNTH